MSHSKVSALQIFKSGLASHSTCLPCIIAISALVAQTNLVAAAEKRDLLADISALVRDNPDLKNDKFVLSAGKTLTPDLSRLAKGWGIEVSAFEQAPGRFNDSIDEALPKVFAKLGHLNGAQMVKVLAPIVSQLMANSHDVKTKKAVATTIINEARQHDMTGADVDDVVVAALVGLTPDLTSTIASSLGVSENYVLTIKQGMGQKPASDMHTKGADKAKGDRDKHATGTFVGKPDKSGDTRRTARV